MELVEGPTLADRKQGALPLNESLAIARQIAEALEAAHEKGRVHRGSETGQHQDHAGRRGESARLRSGEGD
jgi:serine/threonine protein kinase